MEPFPKRHKRLQANTRLDDPTSAGGRDGGLARGIFILLYPGRDDRFRTKRVRGDPRALVIDVTVDARPFSSREDRSRSIECKDEGAMRVMRAAIR
jgi:hypothetical protein